MNNDKYLFILGAPDTEMRGTESILSSLGIPFAHAERSLGVRCFPDDAYGFSLTSRNMLASHAFVKDGKLAFVECSTASASPDLVFDHHNPGDTGYEKQPSEFMEGSSLGQILSFFGIEPTSSQRIICAADHCLTAAYAGLCPGVDRDELLHVRLSWRSKVLGIPLSELFGIVEASVSKVREVFDADEGCADFSDPFEVPQEVGEAAAIANLPVRYVQWSDSGSLKQRFKGGTPEAVRNFMSRMSMQGFRVYGNPARGYAGAYVR